MEQSHDDPEWTTVMSRNNRKKMQYPEVHINPLNFNRFRETPPPKFRARPIRHFWNGFDEMGAEKWFLELENGNILSCKDQSYVYLVKRYFPNDPY